MSPTIMALGLDALQARATNTTHQWTVDTLDTDAYHNRLIIGVDWAMTALCIILVAARFYTRIRITKSLYSDDWLALVSLALQILFTAFVTLAIQSQMQNTNPEVPFTVGFRK